MMRRPVLSWDFEPDPEEPPEQRDIWNGRDRIILTRLVRPLGWTWVQLSLCRKPEVGSHWAFRGLVRIHRFGWLWIATMRMDAAKRSYERFEKEHGPL